MTVARTHGGVVVVVIQSARRRGILARHDVSTVSVKKRSAGLRETRVVGGSEGRDRARMSADNM